MASQTLEVAQEFYSEPVDKIREREYPSLHDVTYLDHAGTGLYAKSLIEEYSRELNANLFGNPHSASSSSELTSSRIEDIRLKALRFFNADPDIYDLVFVANATTGIKLVADTLRDFSACNGHRGFWYGYHVDSHTSLVGVRELADLGNRCFKTDDEVRNWIDNEICTENKNTRLFAYPAQSNMNGRRLPLRWCDQIRTVGGQNIFTLLDAASFVSTAPLDLEDSIRPDFAVVSFYKIFGFPDLGALIVRKDSGHIFRHRKFFGGGTVDMVTVDLQWHSKKEASIHEQLEDGTLPFHNIIALDAAFHVHQQLYGSMASISTHTSRLAQKFFNRLSSIRHSNGRPVCHFYMSPGCSYDDSTSQGPILALNLLDSKGGWVGKSEIEKLASIKAIHIRSGTLCNPGGTASLLGLSHREMEANYNSGQRCGDENDIMQGKPTGVLRLSLGAMSNSRDIDRFVEFITEFYADQAVFSPLSDLNTSPAEINRFYVESLCIYPIKSCSGFTVSPGTAWKVYPEGLAWDREWCIVHQGTGAALSQKRYPRMALIRPFLDLDMGFLRISAEFTTGRRQLNIPLWMNDTQLVTTEMGSCHNAPSRRKSSLVCGDRITVQVYSSSEVYSFFSDLLGVPCTLARFPPHSSSRHAKTTSFFPSYPHIQRNQMPGSYPLESSQKFIRSPREIPRQPSSLLLSNESPILLISRSSVNRLNEQIKANASTTASRTANNKCNSAKAVPANVFRANIVVAENLPHSSITQPSPTVVTGAPVSFPSLSSFEQPYIEDNWSSLRVLTRDLCFNVLGSCQRCQMVCVDQLTAERHEEPLSTLAKTRRIGGKIMFGRHLAPSALGDDGNELLDDQNEETERISRFIMVGDVLVPSCENYVE